MSNQQNVPFSSHSASYRPPSGAAPGPGMHSHDGVSFHDASHSAPVARNPGMHSHDGVNFHGAHDAAPEPQQYSPQQLQQLQQLMNMMRQQQLQADEGGHGSHSHGGEPCQGHGGHGDHGGNTHQEEDTSDVAGTFATRVLPYTSLEGRDFATKAFCIGIAGPCGSGKTTLVKALCAAFKNDHKMCVIVNDMFTTLDAEELIEEAVLDKELVKGLTTGIWSRVAIDEDVEDNFKVSEALSQKFACEILLLEASGDNLGANFDRNLSDFTIFLLDTAAGEKMPLKGGKGVTQCDLLVLNKTDLAPHCDVNLSVLEANARQMRGDGPVVLAALKKGDGVQAIVEAVRKQFEESGAKAFFKK
ncbi:hypothetical protein HDU98_005538 [Podochytrium sp. JEL0797]|nr:hypothetical protein HDU98_005538 [Podochytrium sp. JEL0797]